MKKYILAILIVLAVAVSLSPTVSAYNMRPFVSETPMTYRLSCGVKTCVMYVDLKLPFESFAPAEVLWQHKINNSTYTQPKKASTTYVFNIARESQVVTVRAESYGMTFVKAFDIKL